MNYENVRQWGKSSTFRVGIILADTHDSYVCGDTLAREGTKDFVFFGIESRRKSIRIDCSRK